MKKCLIATLALTLALALTGCGNGTDEKSEGVMTYAEYDAAALDTQVVIEAYVQAKQSWWENQATVYAQDKDGAYFLYNMACSPPRATASAATGRDLYFYLPSRIFLMSLSLFNASTGVRLFTSSPSISSRICVSTGSSSWKKLSCTPSLGSSMCCTFGLPAPPTPALSSDRKSTCLNSSHQD